MIELGDSSSPPASYPAVDGWGFYIGGNTPHVWADREVAAIPCRYRLPIFTRSNPGGSAQATTDAQAAVAWATAHGQPKGTLIGLDLEAAVDAVYVTVFDAVVVASGYRTVAYGQLSTIQRNPTPSGGFWVGDWDGVDTDPSWMGKQWANRPGWDLSAFASDAPLWDTRPASQTLPAAPALEEDEMSTQAEAGFATVTWSTGTKHVVQAAFDTIGGNAPTLRVVLLLGTGPLVLAEAWKPTAAARTLEFTAHQGAAYGIELQPVGTPARYAVTVS